MKLEICRFICRQNYLGFNSKFDKKSLKQLVNDFEKCVLNNKIQQYGVDLNAKNKIAEELDIGIASLYRKLKKYKLE